MLFSAARRLVAVPRSGLLSRALATEATAARPPQAREYAAVEDLHHRTAEEILKERDSAQSASESSGPSVPVGLQPRAPVTDRGEPLLFGGVTRLLSIGSPVRLQRAIQHANYTTR